MAIKVSELKLMLDTINDKSSGFSLSFEELEEAARLVMEVEDDSELFLEEELATLLNRHSRKNVSDTPDFVLAGYMVGCLEAFEAAMVLRAKWFSSAMPSQGGQSKDEMEQSVCCDLRPASMTINPMERDAPDCCGGDKSSTPYGLRETQERIKRERASLEKEADCGSVSKPLPE